MFSKLKSLLKNKIALSAAIVLAVLGLAGAAAVAQFGPDRPTKAYHQGVKGFDHVTFNSFTGVPNIGDERNFLTGKIDKAPDGFYDPMNQVRDGNEILVRVYVHNNADKSLNTAANNYKGIARNTMVRAEIPTGLKSAHQPKAFISADNAKPKVIYDTLDINANYPFELDYVEGSASLTSNFVTHKPLSDNIVKGGVKIGDDVLDGNIPGCFEYVALVSFKVKVKAPNFKIDKTVRVEGEDRSQWREMAHVEPGQTVEWKLNFQNTGRTQLNDVDIFDQLPSKMDLVSGSTVIYNSKYPNGVNAGTDDIVKNGIDVGDYAAGSNAIVVFKAKAPEKHELECGENHLVNKGFARPKGQATVTDDASIKVKKKCKPQKPVYSCDLLTAEKLGGKEVKFTADATALNGATIVGYTFDFGDGTIESTTSNMITHTYTGNGPYNASVSVQVEVNGQVHDAVSQACHATIKFKEKPKEPIYSCDLLTAEKLGGKEVKFTADATALNGATIVGYTFDFGDGTIESTTSNMITHAYTGNGPYNASVSVQVEIDGEVYDVVSQACETRIKFKEKPHNPAYACDLLSAEKTGEGREVKFTAAASASGGATIERYIYDFGDGSEPLITDQNVVYYTYSTDGNFVASVKVEVNVDGETHIAESQSCLAQVNFTSTPPEPPVTPVTPGKLPETGAGDMLAIFLGVTGISTFGYFVVSRRFV